LPLSGEPRSKRKIASWPLGLIASGDGEAGARRCAADDDLPERSAAAYFAEIASERLRFEDDHIAEAKAVDLIGIAARRQCDGGTCEPPHEPYRSLACCSRPPVRRYLCSTRRHGRDCDQPITRAEPLEEQLVEWISDFRPDEELRAAILASIRSAARGSNNDGLRRRELVRQLERLRDLYVMGDLSKSEYVLRRQALEEQLARIRPPFDPRLDKAEELLADFGRVWQLEHDPAKRRRLLATLFDRVWQDGGTIVAVKPREPFIKVCPNRFSGFHLAAESARSSRFRQVWQTRVFRLIAPGRFHDVSRPTAGRAHRRSPATTGKSGERTFAQPFALTSELGRLPPRSSARPHPGTRAAPTIRGGSRAPQP
jgi:hypothetical protein